MFFCFIAAESSVRVRADCEEDNKVPAICKRLQQANNIPGERNARTECCYGGCDVSIR
ncbi:hypothetical protein SAMN05192541_106154 [Bradyrhizobium arachidis]|nr:hypothetical protein SAMN05192541_106154 [Bradyrhizobium arachidis]